MDKSIIQTITSLPSLSPVVHKVSSLITDPKTSAQTLADALKLDPGITGRVLKLANSSYFGFSNTVSSLQNAVALLGHKRIFALVISSSVAGPFANATQLPFSLKDFWRHSVATAFIAESIARYIRRQSPIDVDELFSASILHDIGKLVLGIHDAAAFGAVMERARVESVPVSSLESSTVHHGFAGGHVAQHWSLPVVLIEAIAYHHIPERAKEHVKYAAVIHFADAMAHAVGFNVVPDEVVPDINEEFLKLLKISPEELRVIANNAMDNGKKMDALLESVV